jgi:hypothetical protein
VFIAPSQLSITLSSLQHTLFAAIRPEAVGISWQQSLDGLEELLPYFVLKVFEQ